MNAIKDMERTIKQQMEENKQLKDHLLQQTQKLEKFKLGSTSVGENEEKGTKVNGFMKVSPQAEINNNSNGLYHLSVPSSKSHSPARKEGEYDPMSPSLEIHPNKSWKQDLAIKVQEQQEEISKLKKQLSDYTIKESQIRTEKNVLEKRIAHMRTAFVQQQQELVEAQSRALSYRQDSMEENSQLKFSLQAVQQERMTFLSSLVPPLSEHNLRPSVMDAQPIVYNFKVLLKQLQEKLILNEENLKEPNYVPPQRPPYSFDVAISNLREGPESIPRSAYPHARSPAFPSLTGFEKILPPINRYG